MSVHEEFKGNRLPPFPVDDTTLDMLWTTMHPDWSVQDRSSVGDFLRLMAQLGGSDPEAVESEEGGTYLMRDQGYHEHDVISALVTEVRSLRAQLSERPGP